MVIVKVIVIVVIVSGGVVDVELQRGCFVPRVVSRLYNSALPSITDLARRHLRPDNAFRTTTSQVL